MKFPKTSFSLLRVLTQIVGCSREQGSNLAIPAPSGATNKLFIHLQEGFDDGREAVISVDGREVYRGMPKTNPLLGLAAEVSAAATSSRPRVSFTIPSKQITWTQQIDLSAGAAVGVNVTKSGAVEVRQATGFGYD